LRPANLNRYLNKRLVTSCIRECNQKFPDWVDNEITKINTRWEAIQRVMVEKLTRLTHKIALKLHLVAESCTICSSRARRPVRKLLDTPSYIVQSSCSEQAPSYLMIVWERCINWWC
jgi:hypothetical protein